MSPAQMVDARALIRESRTLLVSVGSSVSGVAEEAIASVLARLNRIDELLAQGELFPVAPVTGKRKLRR